VPLSLSLVAVFSFCAGAVVAVPFGFFSHYSETPAVYLGCMGVPLVIGAIHWGSSRAHSDYEQLRPIFTIEDDAYRRLITEWFGRFRDVTGTVLASLGMFALITTALIAAYITTDRTRRRLHLEALRPRLFSAIWYSHNFKVSGFLILLLWGLLVSITLATGLRLLVLNIGFMLRLRRLPVIPMPTIVRARLRRIMDLYVGATLTWSAGVALFGILFYQRYDIFSGGILITLFLIGLLTFLAPQVVCRRYIIQSYERLCAIGLVQLYAQLGLQLAERDSIDPLPASNLADNLSDLSQLMNRPKTWVYDSQAVILWVASQVIALLAILPHNTIRAVLGHL